MTDRIATPCRLLRKVVQQGRSERRDESYAAPHVEPLSDASMPPAACINSLVAIGCNWERRAVSEAKNQEVKGGWWLFHHPRDRQAFIGRCSVLEEHVGPQLFLPHG